MRSITFVLLTFALFLGGQPVIAQEDPETQIHELKEKIKKLEVEKRRLAAEASRFDYASKFELRNQELDCRKADIIRNISAAGEAVRNAKAKIKEAQSISSRDLKRSWEILREACVSARIATLFAVSAQGGLYRPESLAPVLIEKKSPLHLAAINLTGNSQTISSFCEDANRNKTEGYDSFEADRLMNALSSLENDAAAALVKAQPEGSHKK